MAAILNRYDTVYRVYLVKDSGGDVVYKAVVGQKHGRPPKHEEQAPSATSLRPSFTEPRKAPHHSVLACHSLDCSSIHRVQG